MLRPIDAYAGQIEPATSADYPHGKARNDSTPGDRLGTPWVAKQLNDMYGFSQALVTEAGITPSGSVETAQVSDLLDAVRAIAKADLEKTGDYMASSDTTLAARGWLPLSPDGTTGVRATDVALFSLFGTAYGVGNGTTTFGLPKRDYANPQEWSYPGSGTTIGSWPHAGMTAMEVDYVTGDVWAITSSDGGTVWKLTAGAGTWTVIGSYPGTAPKDIAVNPLNGDVWVVDGDTGEVYLLDGGAGSFATEGAFPDADPVGIAINPNTDIIYVLDSGTDTIYYYNKVGGNTYIAIAQTQGGTHQWLALDESNGDLFWDDSNNITVLRGGSGASGRLLEYPGTNPGNPTIDQVTGDLYVGDSDTNKIYKLPRRSNVWEEALTVVDVTVIAFNQADGSLWVKEFVPSTNTRKFTATLAAPAVPWYVKT